MNKMEIDCGFGVTITPTKKEIMGLEYSDYEIKNSEYQK